MDTVLFYGPSSTASLAFQSQDYHPKVESHQTPPPITTVATIGSNAADNHDRQPAIGVVFVPEKPWYPIAAPPKNYKPNSSHATDRIQRRKSTFINNNRIHDQATKDKARQIIQQLCDKDIHSNEDAYANWLESINKRQAKSNGSINASGRQTADDRNDEAYRKWLVRKAHQAAIERQKCLEQQQQEREKHKIQYRQKLDSQQQSRDVYDSWLRRKREANHEKLAKLQREQQNHQRAEAGRIERANEIRRNWLRRHPTHQEAIQLHLVTHEKPWQSILQANTDINLRKKIA